MNRNTQFVVSNEIYDKISEVMMITSEYKLAHTDKILEEARLMALLEVCQPSEGTDNISVE